MKKFAKTLLAVAAIAVIAAALAGCGVSGMGRWRTYERNGQANPNMRVFEFASTQGNVRGTVGAGQSRTHNNMIVFSRNASGATVVYNLVNIVVYVRDNVSSVVAPHSAIEGTGTGGVRIVNGNTTIYVGAGTGQTVWSSARQTNVRATRFNISLPSNTALNLDNPLVLDFAYRTHGMAADAAPLIFTFTFDLTRARIR